MIVALVGAVMLGPAHARWRFAALGMAATAVAVAMPTLMVVGVLGGTVHAVRSRLRRTRAREFQNTVDLASLCDLTAIALTGGLGLHPALTIAADQVGGDVGAELNALLRRGRVDGIAAVMATADGTGRRLYRIVGQAAGSGSSLVESVARLADDLQVSLTADELEKVRRLPVAMLFPLTMLILPGFLLLAIAPAIVDAFGRLDL